MCPGKEGVRSKRYITAGASSEFKNVMKPLEHLICTLNLVQIKT